MVYYALGGRDGRGMYYTRERREMHTIFWLGNLRRRVHLENLGIDGKIILEWILGKYCGKV
jgi:hypothetical protein